MRTKRQFKVAAVILAVLALLHSGADTARAGLILTMEQVGPDVVMSGSGSLNLTGFSPFFTSPDEPGIAPDAFFLVGAPASIDVYRGSVTGPTNIGPGTAEIPASSGTGDLFGLQFAGIKALGVPAGYVSGDPLSGSATYAGMTFSSLGVTPGTYDWTLRNGDTISLTIANVPEPSSLALCALGGLALAGWRKWKGRRQATA